MGSQKKKNKGKIKGTALGSRNFEFKNWLFFAIILIYSIILYKNSIYNAYAIDDHLVTPLNASVQKGISGIPEILTSFYSVEEQLAYGYRPLTKITYAFEYEFFGMRPGISHFINLLLYAAIGMLLFSLLRKMFKGYHPLMALSITLLFLAHPIHSEVVNNLKNREEILSLLFGLLTLQMLMKWIPNPKNKFLFWAAVFFIIGMLAKPTIGVFILIIPLFLYFFSDIRPRAIIIMSLSALILMIAVLLLPKLFLPFNTRPFMYYENPLFFEKAIGLRLGTGFYVLLFYLKKLLYPFPLLFYYGYDMISLRGITNIWSITGLIIYAVLFIYAVLKIKEKHPLSFAILFFMISVAMYSNIINPGPGIVAERFLFVPSIGYCIAIGYLIAYLSGFRKGSQAVSNKNIYILSILMLALLIPATASVIQRNKDWKNHLSLYERDIKHLDKSVKANILYASTLTSKLYEEFERSEQQKIIPLIIKHYKRALELYPDNYEVYNNLGAFYSNTYSTFIDKPLPAYQMGVKYLEKARDLRPESVAPYFNLAHTYKAMEEYDKALENYEKALQLDPSNIRLNEEAADAYFESGNKDDAIRLNKKLSELFPELDLPYINIGNYHLMSGDTLKAIRNWEKAVEKVPQVKLCYMLSKHYNNMGDKKRAYYYYQLGKDAEKKK